MILAEDEVGDRHRPRRDHGARRRPACRARRWPTCCRSPPTCSSSRSRPTGPTACRSTAWRARSTPPPARRSTPPPWTRRPRHAPATSPGVTIEVEAPDLCPRFTARLFEDVKLGPSPPWLKARLMAAGQRPINNVVDITNYVMLAHRPAAARVRLGPRGRRPARRPPRARRREDDHARRRRAHARPRRVPDLRRRRARPRSPGSWAAQRSEVQPTTTRVLMEAANWNGPNIQRTSQRLGLRTEASGRFEKELAPEQAMDGQAVAAQLMIELCRRAAGRRHRRRRRRRARSRRRCACATAKVARLLGTDVPAGEQAELLERLDFGVADGRRRRSTSPCPYFRRNDVTREVDLIEEVARLWGLEKLPGDAALAPRRERPASTREQRLRRRAADALVGAGLSRGDRLELPGARDEPPAARSTTPRRPHRATRSPRTWR